MKKTLIPLFCFALASCTHQKTEQAPQTTPSIDTTGGKSSPSVKSELPDMFGANAVRELGKAINSIFQSENGCYWFASNGEGAFCYDGKNLIKFSTKDGLCDDQVLTIQEDQQGNIWLLTVGGISRFDGKTFVSFPDKGQSPWTGNKGMKMEYRDLWFEFGGGAYHYDNQLFSYLLLPRPAIGSKYANTTDPQKPDPRKLNAYSAYCSLKDKKGQLWLGTQTLGVCRYDGKSFEWFTEKGLGGPAVRALFEDSQGNLWFGNNGGGLFRYDGKTLTNITEEKGLGNPAFLTTGKPAQGTLARVWAVNEDNFGNLWIGTYDSGVWCYDGSNFTNYTTKDGLASNAISTIYKDRKGALWFGTDGAGVCTFNGVTFSRFKL